MTRIMVSKVRQDQTVDLKTVVGEDDRVEAYRTPSTLASRVKLEKRSGSVFNLPMGTSWKAGDEVNILINYLAGGGQKSF